MTKGGSHLNTDDIEKVTFCLLLGGDKDLLGVLGFSWWQNPQYLGYIDQISPTLLVLQPQNLVLNRTEIHIQFSAGNHRVDKGNSV